MLGKEERTAGRSMPPAQRRPRQKLVAALTGCPALARLRLLLSIATMSAHLAARLAAQLAGRPGWAASAERAACLQLSHLFSSSVSTSLSAEEAAEKARALRSGQFQRDVLAPLSATNSVVSQKQLLDLAQET